MPAARVLVTGGGTGGHLVPALNLARALRSLEPELELLYLGSRHGLEARILPGEDLPYRLLPVRPLSRGRPGAALRSMAALARSLLPATGAARRFRPDVVLATGGYAAGPALLWARAAGRTVVLQEQNAVPGLVTRVASRWATELHLGFPEARDGLRPGRGTTVRMHGNPVWSEAPPPVDRFDWPAGRILLVAGGSQGASGLNRILLEDLRQVEAWPGGLRVVWIAGRDHAGALRNEVAGLAWRERIRIVPWVAGLAGQLDRVTLAVSRAGAMFCSELTAAGVPSLLVPYPHAAGGHQLANARALERAGAARVLREGALGPGELWRAATSLLADGERLASMAAAARGRGAPEAALLIARDVLRLARGADPEDVDTAGTPTGETPDDPN